MSGIHQKIRFGDIIYIAIGEKINMHLSSTGFSLTNFSPVEVRKMGLINLENYCLKDYENDLFVVLPTMNEDFLTHKLDLDERINSLSYILNITEDSNRMKDVNTIMQLYQNLKKEVYDQNKILLEKIGHPVVFSENIILIHLKSQMFLSTENTDRNSNKKKKNSIILTENYSDECIFQFDSYKSNEKGDSDVFSNQNIYIRKCEKNIWANNPYLYYEVFDSIKQTKTKDTNIKINSRKEMEPNARETTLSFTENSEMAKPFQIKIFSNYIDPSSQALSFVNPLWIVCQSVDKYIVINKERNLSETNEANILQTDNSQEKENDSFTCNDDTKYMVSLVPVEKEKESFNINGLFCVEQIDKNYIEIMNDLRMSPYIEFNNVIRFRHVATKKYLAFIKSDTSSQGNSMKMNILDRSDTFRNIYENNDRTRLKGNITLKDIPDDDCNWIFMESYILLDREGYEKAKMDGMEYRSHKNISGNQSRLKNDSQQDDYSSIQDRENNQKNIVKKKEILRIFHLKSKKFLSFEDMFNNNTKNKNTKIEKVIEGEPYSNQILHTIHPNEPNEDKSKSTITLNKLPVDNDLFRLIHSTENQSREMFFILNLRDMFFNLVTNCTKKDISSLIKEIASLEENSSKPEILDNNNQDSGKNMIRGTKYLKVPSPNKIIGEEYNNENVSGTTELNSYKNDWINLRVCFETLRDFCINNYDKRFDYSAPTGKPIATRQDFLFEQGFLQLTLKFLENANDLLTAYGEFRRISEQNSLNIGNNLNIRKNANKKRSIFYLDSQNFLNITNKQGATNYNKGLQGSTNAITNNLKQADVISNLFKDINNAIKASFEFMTAICKSNPHCKEYVFNKRDILWDYLLTLKESSQCLIEIIKDDENYINEIITNKLEKESNNNKLLKQISSHNSYNLINRAINYMNELKTYDVQSLTLFSKLMKSKGKGITSNQAEIFQSLMIEKREKFLLKITPKFNDRMFYVVYRTELFEFECRSLIDLCKYKNNITEYEANIVLYLSAQLNLYADMCYGRNYTCIETIREKFPLDLLIYHISYTDLYEPIVAALINILNTNYIDIAPHLINHPTMIKYLHDDRIVRSKNKPVKTFIPLDRLNLILCLALFNLYNLRHEKYYTNTANIELINNLISFRLYENVEYLDEEENHNAIDNEIDIQQGMKNNKIVSIPNLKEEIRKAIEETEKNFQQGKINVDNVDDLKLKKKQFDEEDKSKGTGNTFFQRIGYKFFEYSKESEEIGTEYLIYVMNFINDFFLEQIVLRSIDSNMGNKNIIAETFKSINRQDILTRNNMNYLMKTMERIKQILSSNFGLTNNKSVFKTDKDILMTSLILKENPKRKVLILPMVKKISRVIDVILNLKIENITDSIIDNLVTEDSKVITKLLYENRLPSSLDKPQEPSKRNSAYKIAVEEFEHRKNFKNIFLSDEYYLYQLFDGLDRSKINQESEFLNSTILKTMQELIVKILEINIDESMIKNLVKLFTRLSSQRKEIINYIKKIEIITDKQDLKMLFLCDFLVKELSLLTEKTEVWMNIESCRTVTENNQYETSKFGFFTNAINSTNALKKFQMKSKPTGKELRLTNFYMKELCDMFLDKQNTEGYLSSKPGNKIKLIQTILFSLQLNVTLFSLLGEVCQVYRINEMEMSQMLKSNKSKRKIYSNFNKQLEELIRNIFNLLRFLVHDSETFQAEIQVPFLQLKSYEFLYNLGFIKILKEIVHSNHKFAINNAGLILEITRNECNVKVFYKLFDNLKYVEQLAKVVSSPNNEITERIVDNHPIKSEMVVLTEKSESARNVYNKNSNFFQKVKESWKLNQGKQNLLANLNKFYKILKLMNNFVRSVKEERYITSIIRQYEEILKILSQNESFTKIVASDFVSHKSKDLLRVKMKIFSQLIKMGCNLIRVNEKLKELIRNVFPVRILEEKILSLEMRLDIEYVSKAIQTAKEAIEQKQKTAIVDNENENKEIPKTKLPKLFEASKKSRIEIKNIPRIFQGIFSYGDVNVDLSFIYLIKNFFNTKYHGCVLFSFNGLEYKKKDNNTLKFFFKILDKDIKIYEELKELFEIHADEVFTKIIKIFKKSTFKYFFKGMFKIISNLVGYFNQDFFITHAEYVNFMPAVRATIEAYKNVFGDFILEENLELPEYKSILNYINDKKDLFQDFFMNFNLNLFKKEERIVYKLVKAMNELILDRKVPVIRSLSSENNFGLDDKKISDNNFAHYPIRKYEKNFSLNFDFDIYFNSKNKKYSDILSELNKEEYFNTPYTPLWYLTMAFTEDFLNTIDKQETKNYIENELKLLARYLNSKVNFHHPLYYYINNNSSLDNYIQPSFHLMNIFLKFVQESYLSKRYSDEIIQLIKLFTYFIEADPEFLEVPQTSPIKTHTHSSHFKNKMGEIKEMCFKYKQNLFIKNGSVEVFLKIICEINQNFSKDVFQMILKFFNMVLAGGNKEAQEKFYELFDLFENSENLFFYLKQSFNKDIFIYLKGGTDRKQSKKDIFYSELMKDELKFLQNLTENHFVKLQNYIREQTSNKVSYNFVSIIVEYMNMLLSKMSQIDDQNKLNKKTTSLYYNRLLSCLETLCEFLQGPCKKNQETLVRSKVIEIFDKILRETECADLNSDDMMTNDDENLQKKLSDHLLPDEDDDDDYRDVKSIATIKTKKEAEITRFTTMNSKVFFTTSNNFETLPGRTNSKKKKKNSSLFYLLNDYEKSMLIYKIGLVLLAAIEGRKTKDDIIQKLLRDFDLKLFYKKLTELYVKIKEIYKNQPEYFLYSLPDDEDQGENDGKKKFVVESGFNLYVFLSSLYEIETEETEFKKLFQKILKQSNIFGANVSLENRGLFSYFGKFKKAIQYFKENCLKIEIYKDEEIQTVYFPKLNFFKNLSYEMLKNFREHANITSVQTKLVSLLSVKEDMYRNLKQLYGLELYFEKLGPGKYLFMYPKLLSSINLAIGIIINIMILLSFTREITEDTLQKDERGYKSLLGLSYKSKNIKIKIITRNNEHFHRFWSIYFNHF